VKMTRRDFVKMVAATAVVPSVSEGDPATTWVVNRSNMWPPDADDMKTLARCNRFLAVDENDTLALVHRGSIPLLIERQQAWADLSRAISLEPANPCCWYVRGTCFELASDLREAISLLSKSGLANLTSTDDAELYFMAHRELGSVLEAKVHGLGGGSP
jgi:hypothetical protein